MWKIFFLYLACVLALAASSLQRYLRTVAPSIAGDYAPQHRARVSGFGSESYPLLRSLLMYCEHCGLQIFPKHPECTRCGESPTYQLFQLASLTTLFLVVVCNGVVAWLLLPRFAHANHGAFYFRSWLWLTDNAAVYGWV